MPIPALRLHGALRRPPGDAREARGGPRETTSVPGLSVFSSKTEMEPDQTFFPGCLGGRLAGSWLLVNFINSDAAQNRVQDYCCRLSPQCEAAGREPEDTL